MDKGGILQTLSPGLFLTFTQTLQQMHVLKFVALNGETLKVVEKIIIIYWLNSDMNNTAETVYVGVSYRPVS
jgi:hypothetical protein